ncbi:MAG: hypothetical protein IT183_07715 [Acidobacteria bacterium]|nr:hypothetical protein [Acidobacteriota bacterium]
MHQAPRVMVDQRRTTDSIALFLASFVVLATGAFWGLPSGKAVSGALVILDGGVPYRDFWSMYAPGQFYAIAALFWLFGRELLVQAIAVCVVRAASAVAFAGLLRRVGADRRLSLALASVFTLTFWTTHPEFTDYAPALFFLLLALGRTTRYLGGEGGRHLRWAGLWLGCAACFKHDVAAYVAIGTTFSMIAAWLMARERPEGWLSPVRAVPALAVPAILAAAPLTIWTAWTAGRHAWNDLFVFPATVFRKVRGNQYPALLPDIGPLRTWLSDVTNAGHAVAAAESLEAWVVLNAPQLVFAIGLATLLTARRRLGSAGSARLMLFLSGMPFFWAAAHVQQNTHPYSMAILGACVAVIAWASVEVRWRRALLGPLTVAVAVYAGGLMTSAAISGSTVLYEWPGSRVLDLPGLRGIRLPARLYSAYQPLGSFFRTHTREGEAIYTGLVRHDAIVINNPLLYAIAGRPACCGYTELHPGVADRAPVQDEIIRRIEETDVRAIALWQFGWPDSVLEARRQHTVAGVPDAGATRLDRYIAERFRTVETHGEYHILWRRDLPLPGSPEP